MQCKMTQIIIKYLTTYLIECLLEKKIRHALVSFFLASGSTAGIQYL